MKYVKVQSISIRNFLSIGTEPVNVEFTPGLHIITGINKDKQDRRNGVGKSTIADAIHFAIFGTTIRDLKKENIVNHTTGKDCCVTLTLTISENGIDTRYKICRSIEPSFCKLYINDTDKTLDSIPNTTKKIEDTLNINQDIFQNCVVMTLNNTTPFMAKKKVEKRKFIEGIFNLSIFSEMLTHLRQEYNDTKRDLDIYSTKIEEIHRNVETFNKQQIQYEKDKEIQRVNLLKSKTNNQNNIDLCKSRYRVVIETDIEKTKLKITTLQARVDECESIRNNNQLSISTKEAECKFKTEAVSKLGTDKDTCPVCLKSVTTHDKQIIDKERAKIYEYVDEINIKISKNHNNISAINTLRDALKREINKQTSTLSDYGLIQKENDNLDSKIKQYQEWTQQIDIDTINLNNATSQFVDMIENESKRRFETQKKIDDIKSNLSTLDVVKFVVSEEGVKSLIVRRILQLFNNKINLYLEKMDANCMCMFNEYFEEEIIDEKGKSCSYNNFSGAERKNIDLACLFAFMDIRKMQGNAVYNFSIYDELFDSSLDERGVELVLEILKDRVASSDESIMIISHRKESIKAATGDIIFLEKQSGITRRVESTPL